MTTFTSRLLSVVGASALAGGLVAVPLAQPAAAQTVAQATIVSANPENFTPNILDGKVNAIAQMGTTIVLGGSFTRVQASSGGPILTRSNIVAFSATNGAISSFAPTISGEVYDLEPSTDGVSVYVVGSFTQAAGSASSRVARINITTGVKVAGFNVPTINGTVKNVDLVGSRLLIGGSFSTVGGVNRTRLASLDPTNGALTSFLNLSVTGANAAGGTQVLKMAVAPNGSRLVVIGNFTSVAGHERLQIAMIDLTGDTATLAPWATGFYTNSCNPVFNTYMRDLDFSPDSSYFVVSTTGAYGGDQSPCDVIARWETSAGPGQVATWLDHTGGDTSYAVAITGAAVYVGGHMRWMNNPYAGDEAGPGAVPREGIAALDPQTGLPLSWNPGRSRGVGVFDMLATSTGLWVGSDTDLIGGETRRKIAFFPLAGGTTLPVQKLGATPNDVYLLGRAGSSADPNVLYRVNAGGPALQSADDGPDWAADVDFDSPYRISGSNTADWGSTGAVNASVPNSNGDRAPAALFATERWDPADDPEMNWVFAVPNGEAVTVRLYLSNRCGCTSGVGDRVFDVDVEGTTVLEDWDLVARYGDQVGAMEDFDVVSDGTINIDFGHVAENSLVNGIEIIRQGTGGGGGGGLTAADDIQRRYTDGTTVGPNVVMTPTASWSLNRGAFLVDNTLYTGAADGTFARRTVTGTVSGVTFGALTTIPMYGSTFAGEIPNLTGIVYSQGRIYYTLYGRGELFWRWFSPQSHVVGAVPYLVDGNIGDLAPDRVQGMFLSGTSLYAADRVTGDLVRVSLSGTTVTGSATTVDTTNDWQARGMFLWNGLPAGASNINPTANASGDCPAGGGLTCTFDGSLSTDSDGSIASYAWTFSGGGTATGATPSHTYALAGPQTATLTVTDNLGGTNSTTVNVTVVAPPTVPPVASFTQTCVALSCTFDASASNDPDGGPVTYAWVFRPGQNGTGVAPSHTFPAADSYDVLLTVTDDESVSTSVTKSVTVTAPVGSTVAFRSSATANTNAMSTTIPSPGGTVSGDVLLMFVTSNTGAAPNSPPGGWTFVGERLSSTDLRTVLYQRVSPGAGSLGSVTFGGITKTNLTVLAYSGADAVPAVFGSLAKTTASTSYVTPGASVTTAGSFVVSFWSMKSSTVPLWTEPAGTQIRANSAGTGGGLVVGLAVDGGASAVGPSAGLTATSQVSSAKATGWTVVLRPAP